MRRALLCLAATIGLLATPAAPAGATPPAPTPATPTVTILTATPGATLPPAAAAELTDVLGRAKLYNEGVKIGRNGQHLHFVPVTLSVDPSHPGHAVPDQQQVSADAGYRTKWTGYEGWEPNGNWYGESEADWTVPNLGLSPNARYVTMWPGIGSGADYSHELIQAGTNAFQFSNHTYYSWWLEVFPSEPLQVSVNFPVYPGDHVAVDLYFQPSPVGFTAVFDLTNWTRSAYTSTHLTFTQYEYSGQQADVMLERPTVNGGIPLLAWFGTVFFDFMSWRTEGVHWCIGQLPNTRLDMINTAGTLVIAQSRFADSSGCSFNTTRLGGD